MWAWPPHYLSNKTLQPVVQCKRCQRAESTSSCPRFLWIIIKVLTNNNWWPGTMPSGKTVKLILYEALQFAALVTPVFVIMERFARLIRDVRSGDHTAYWLVVAVSIAYVTSVTLLVWVPLKYLLLKQRGFMAEITLWWVQRTSGV